MSFAPGLETISCILFYGYLLWVSVQDLQSQRVYRISHGMGLMAVFMLLPDCELQNKNILLLVLVMGIEYLFGRFLVYGIADVFVFLNCALFAWMTQDAYVFFLIYWWMKAASGTLFVTVYVLQNRQFHRRLPKPQPYIPYILCAFTLTNLVFRA